MRTIAMLAIVSGLAAVPAAADEQSGIFVGVSGGRADISETLDHLDLGELGVGLQIEDSSPTWSAFGGYRMNSYLGVRGGYVDFQTFDDLLELAPVGDVPDVDLDLEGWMISLDANLPLGNWLSVTGRAGYMDWESRLAIDDFDFQEADSGTDPFLGGGAELHLGPHVGVEASYTRFDLNGSDVDYTALGLRVIF